MPEDQTNRNQKTNLDRRSHCRRRRRRLERGRITSAFTEIHQKTLHIALADRQDRGTPAGRPVDAETSSGANPPVAIEPDHPQPGADDQHDGRNHQPSAADAGAGEGNRVPRPIGLGQHRRAAQFEVTSGGKGARCPHTAAGAERQAGWLPFLLKRWFNLSVGKQAEVDRARLEVERLETEIRMRKLFRRQQQKPARHSLEDMPPNAAATEISPNVLQMPIGRGFAGRVTTQTVFQAPSTPAVPDGLESPTVQSAKAEDQLPTPDS